MTVQADVSMGGAGDFDRDKARGILENFGRKPDTWGTFLEPYALRDRWNDHDARWSHPELGHDEFGDMTDAAIGALEELTSKGTYNGVDYDKDGNRQLSEGEIAAFVDTNFAAPDMANGGLATEVNSRLPDKMKADPAHPDHKPSEKEDADRHQLVKDLTDAFGNKPTIAK
jgi:hypothetical protein